MSKTEKKLRNTEGLTKTLAILFYVAGAISLFACLAEVLNWQYFATFVLSGVVMNLATALFAVLRCICRALGGFEKEEEAERMEWQRLSGNMVADKGSKKIANDSLGEVK